MDLTLIHKIIVVLINVVGLGLAFWVYFANRKERVNQMFFLMTIFILLWIVFGYLGSFAKQAQEAVVWYRLKHGAVSLFYVAVYFFAVHFPRKDKMHPFLDKAVLFLGIFFFYLTVFTNLIFKDVEVKEWGNEIIKGDWVYFFYTTAISLTFLVIIILFKKYFKLSEQKKIKVQYFLIGTFVFALVNFIFNIGFPIFGSTYRYQQLGDYSTIFPLFFTAYAIVKRELFGIKVALTQLLVAVMGTVLLLVPFLIETLWLKVLLFIIFLLFCVFGYLLIRYTRREVKQKETLEQKVQERTKEIEERKEDLERFYSLTVGRELKMIELKKKIKELEEKVEQ